MAPVQEFQQATMALVQSLKGCKMLNAPNQTVFKLPDKIIKEAKKSEYKKTKKRHISDKTIIKCPDKQ
jgi:hypothetical protein